MLCAACGTENKAGRKFCSRCGSALARICPECGTANDVDDAFCGECGAAFEERALVAASPEPAPRRDPPAAERRLVSVLFADLVGFTALSEARDAEDVRELQGRYFDTCRRVIELYGGTVEKFIGDAVMAVWGAPVATEDDAERAVRAALELVAAEQVLGEDVGAPQLQARAGVLTGEAAVTIGAEGQGMVTGDLVNTASRVQGVAEPGSVYVGEATRRATEQIVVYEPAGSHEVRGKSGLVPVWRAQRVVSAGRGSLKSEGLEAPFVGRDRELRLLKDLFHASGDDRKAQLASVVGIAGIGKSRLAWEFFKYTDGLPQSTFWHRGRCLAYGEGVAYWALADMVRWRCRIAEDEEPASALAKLQAALAEYVLDDDERRFVEPRLAHLLGLEDGRETREREELFGAWRLFFERLAAANPTVLVFEDMQWADASLLDFVEYLLEWSREHAIYVITLARPELLERRPTWGAGRRMFTALYLEPLAEHAMRDLLRGLVPGLPDELQREILMRAEGVPLYAVETVRMLLDRGLLAQEGSVYRPVGAVETLEVPETLHALIAARLDGLLPEERRLLQDGAVLGKTFTRRALAALSGLDESELDPLLAGLVRKEVLSIQADPRSPEHGQYGFLQDLVRRVAYETLSRRERKARHLAAAAHLERAFAAEQEVVEVLAAHYVAAHEAAPGDDDAAEVKGRAAELLARAGERAGSLAAAAQAQSYFEQAAALTEDALERARLLESAGEMAFRAARTDQAREHLEAAVALLVDAGETHRAARASASVAEMEWRLGRLDDALERMERAFADLQGEEPDADVAALAAQLGRLYNFRGLRDRGSERLETALELAEALWLPELIANALISKGLIARTAGRLEEALALTERAQAIAKEYDLPVVAVRASMNVADTLSYRDRCEQVVGELEQGLSLARRIGHRFWEANLLGELSWPLALMGRWDEALACLREMPEGELGLGSFLVALPELLAARGQLDEARRLLALYGRYESSADMQERTLWRAGQSVVLRAEGKVREALAAAEEGLRAFDALGPGSAPVKVAFPQAVDASLALGDRESAEQLLDRIEALLPGQLAPSLRAHASRFRARLAAADGDASQAAARFANAASTFREFGLPFWLAVTLVEHGEWLGGQHRPRESEPLLAEAAEILERLNAKIWLERIDAPAAARAELRA
jgi:class 3 adenylate cyclase/tetratricopeptide (TPR) repeat protein